MRKSEKLVIRGGVSNPWLKASFECDISNHLQGQLLDIRPCFAPKLLSYFVAGTGVFVSMNRKSVSDGAHILPSVACPRLYFRSCLRSGSQLATSLRLLVS